MPKRKQGEVDNQGVQDFELIELLIRESVKAGPSTSAPKGSDFESFKARFQSYVDQVPSYLHSVGKEGFFPHFFLGSFSTLVDTEIATKLNIEKVYFSFDSAKTLKVAVIKKGEIKSPEDAADKVKLFVIAESGSTKKKFSYGELDEILGNTKVARNNVVRLARDQGKLGVKLVEITKEKDAKGEMIGISVDVKSNKLDKDTSAIHEFKEIKKGLWSNPESDIAKLTNPDVEKVEEPIENILKKVSKIHSEYKNSLVYANQAREAAHHGFVAGALVNFRYRYNLRVYLEQFAGRGYADIVLVPRGKDRSLNAVPIIIELKAGTAAGTTPGSALDQAKDYAKGFQPNTMRVLTVSDNVLCVGLNLDSTEKFSMHISPREDREIAPPTMQALLKEASDWNGRQDTITNVKEKIKQPLERIYHTFPGTPEKGGNYFSRFMLGQLLLANEFERIHLEKSVFLYNEYPLAPSTRSGAQSTERPVTTFMLTKGNQGKNKEVFIFHIREGGKGKFSKKKIPINLPTVSKITEVCISLQEERKSDFFDVEKVNRYNSLNEYKQGKSFFGGEWKNIPYPAELKGTFDAVLESQLVSSQDRSQSIGKYKELFGKLGEAVLPFKVLIEREAHTQAVFHGAFSHYSDIKLGELQESRALVLTEFQTGRGKRIDMVVHGIKFADQASSAKEYDPVGLELKGPRKGETANTLKSEANDQINKEYEKGVTYKTLTDGTEVAFMGVVFDKGANNADSLILMSKDEFASVKVIHSSIFSFSQQQPGKRFDPNSCVGQSSRSKRSITNCLFSRDDVEKFSKGKVDENNVDKIIIDSEKFLTYVKNSQDEAKNAQLVEFVGDKSIEGDCKYLLNKVVGDQGYERYVQNERIKDLQGDIVHQDSSLTKNPKLKGRLMSAAGGIQLIRGIHGAIVSCQDGMTTDCGLNLGGMGWSFASQPIENAVVKITPKVLASAEKVVGKIPSVLGKQTKFAIRVVGVKFGSAVARGTAGALAGVFDIVDIGMSASNLVDCKKRENSDNPCGEKEIRDNIATISFSTISFVSGVALTALGMPGIGIAVGVALMVASGVYSGVSNIVEYEKKYDTTHDENWRIFWHTFAFQPIPQDVQHLAARKEMVNSLAKGVWKALNNDPSNVVAYGIGLGKINGNTLRPDYATIMMNRKNANTQDLSRVIPDYIEGASMICLPHSTSQDYEKGIKSSVPSAKYYCDNAMVISHDKRANMMQKDKTIIYDLSNVDRGTIVGSNEWNNNFLIGSGTANITGGSNKVVNRFVVNNVDFSGKIIGGSNSVNILDLSQLKDTVIGVNVNYRFKPSASGSLKARVNGRWLINDQIDNNGIFNYYYVGRKNKVDEISCMGYSEHFTGIDDRDVIIDSSGGSNKNEKDVVENCKKVIISPYTTVKGGKSNYTFYVKAADYKGKGLYSEIDVDGTGTVIFPEIDLLGDCDQITYSTNSNTLSLKINFGQNNQFTLDVKNYVEQSSNKPHFALIDKNGSNIVPKIERSDSSTIKITSFELHSEHSLDNFDDVASHYKKILNNNKDYKVFSVIRDRVQNQGNSAVPHMVFGSLEDDVINFDQGNMFARGGGGSDVYFISNDINSREVKIDNNSSDKKLDTLFMLAVEKDFSIQQCDLYLKYNNSNIRVKNYFQDPNYRHLIVMNKKGETFIPNIQSMSCSPSSSGKGKLVPFLQATQTQNMFLLPKDFQGDHVVIDSRLEDIEKYKDKDDLLLIRERRENEIPFIIRIEGFYTNRNKWKDISYSLWNNNDLFLSSGLLENVDNVVEYKDKLRGDYERIVKEYIEDFSDSTSIIQHNQKLEKNISTSVGQDEERIGVMVLKNITPDQVEVSSSGTDLIFRDKKSNHTINMNNWNNSESYRISTLEFDLGLEPITIRKLDRFSLPEVRKIQALIDKASENYQNRSKYTPKVENDFKCLISVDDFERGNRDSVHQCLDFPSLQDRVSFTESSCSLEQIEELKNKTPSSNQILTLLEKLENNLLLNGYDSNIIDQCNKWMISSGLGVLKPLVSTAVYEGKWDEVKTLLDKTAKKSNVDIEHKNQCSQNWTPLHYAIYNGNVELSKSVFKAFLEKKGNINALESTSCNSDNWALLHYAVHYGNPDMVSFLIDKGASIEIRSKEGKTPLHLAVEEAKQNVINLLLDRGADIEAKNNDGRTPLYLAAYNNDSGVIELLCNRIKTKSNDAFKMIKQVEFLKKEVVNQANIPSNAKRSVESCISSLRDSIKNAAKKVLKDGMLHNLSASTIELVDRVYNFDERLFDEAIKEAVNDVYWQVDKKEMLKFIHSHNNPGQSISGYMAVFDKMPKNDGTLFELARCIKNTMDSSKYSSVRSEKRSNLEKLKSRLPESVRNAVFSSEVCIKNVKYSEYLYAASYAPYDSERRRVFTGISGGRVKADEWKIENSGNGFYIKNIVRGEYLYAAKDYFNYDNDRRRVFTWIPRDVKNDKFKWEIKPDGNNVYIKNIEHQEYLYAASDYFNYDNSRRQVFTWIQGHRVLQDKWSIKNCGSTRNRRSIQESNGYNQTAVDDKSILTEEDDQQIASRVSAIVEDVERHTFLNQSKNQLDLDSYLNNRERSNADLYLDSMRRDVCSEFNVSGRRNIVLIGNDVCAITSGHETLDIENFPIQEVVINEDVNGKKSLRSILDLHQLVQQVDRDLSIKPIPTIIKDKNDLLIKLSISATSLQQDVITVRLKDALVNKWYKKLQIIFDNAPMEIDDSLGLKSSFFISDEKIIVVTPQDVEEKNKLIISKKAVQYTYLHDKYDLIVTNAFNADIEASELCIIHFKDFYKEPKMETLSIKFADKEILLSNEIDKIRNSDSIDELNNVSSIINSQKNTIPLEAPNSGDINAQGKLGRTSLHLASGAGEWDKAKLLLDRGANTEIQDEFGYTPIFFATQSGKCSIVKLLLDRGANIDAQDKEGKTLLHFAASGNNLDMVQFLLDRGANIEIQDKLAWTPILYAAQSGKWGVVKLLINNGAKFNNEITYQGTPLHFAVQEGNLDMVRFLLDEGADIESQDKDNKKPLHLAVEAGRLNVVKLLLDRGASVNITDVDSQTPLGLATKGDMIEILKKAELDQGLLINARDGNLDKVKDLIAQGANLETKDNTPLHNACNNDRLEAVEYLIEKGASLKAKNKDGKIPLELAEQKGYTDIVEILKQTQLNLDRELLIVVEKEDLGKVKDNIRRGANVNAQSRLGWASVFWAIQKNNLNIVKLLVNNGADINAKDNESWMPLHWAVQLGSLDVVKYLVERGANINALTADGRTSLELAVQKNCVDTIEFLKKAQLDLDKGLLTAVQDGDLNKVESLANRGASLDTKDNNDWTLLHFAASSNKFDIVKFLLDKNANIKAKDVYGNTPLHVAAQYDSKLEIVEFLLDKNASGINDVNNNGSTPLHVATQGNKPSTVKFLLNKGASIQVKDKHNRTPLGLADQEGYTNIAQMIEQRQSDLDEELLTAVQDGDLDKVKSLVSQNANVNTTDMYSWTPLHWAAFKDRLEIAKFLIEKNADIDAEDKGPYGKKPIHVAAENNSKDIIELFLSKGVGINDTDKQGYTPLHYAAWRGRLEVAKFLIEEYANSIFKYNNGSTLPCDAPLSNHFHIIKCSIGEKNILEIRDNSGRVPLHCAASNGKLDVVKYFIDEEKVDVNIKDNGYWTPLHWASWGGHLDIAKYLVDKRANINAKDKGSKIPLNVAIDQKHNDVVKYLEQAQLDLNKELLIAAKGDDLNKVIDLISKGANVNVKDNNDDTPLHLAVGYLDVVKYLISKGANINAKCKAGKTTLDIATYQKRGDVVEYLKQTQLDLDKELLIAVKSGDLNKVIGLFNRGANINAENEYGKKPIHIAAESDYKNIIEFLLSKEGVGVNDTDEQGHTPLHWASWSGHLDMVEYLVGNEADINAKCKAGKTTLDIARDKGHNNVIDYLEKELNQKRGSPAQRKRRHLAVDLSNQPGIAASSGTRPSSWINDLCGWAKEKGGKLASGLVNGLYGDTTKELKDSKLADIQIDSSDQLKSKHPSYDQAQEMEFQYMSKYDARKSNDKNAGAYSKKRGNDRQAKQQYGSKMGNEQGVNQSRVVDNVRQQKLGILHNGPKPTLSHHSNKNHSYFGGQPKKINERKEHIVNYKQCDNSFYKHSNQHKPMISANNKWSERISNERIDSRKMIDGANQKQQGFHQNQQSSHNSKHAHLTRATAQVDVPSTLFALNMLAMKATNQKFNNTPLPKKIQKGMLHAEKVRAEASGRKVGGRIEGTLWFTK